MISIFLLIIAGIHLLHLNPQSREVYVDVYSGRLMHIHKQLGFKTRESIIFSSVGERYIKFFGTLPKREEWKLVITYKSFLGYEKEVRTSYDSAHFQYQNALANLFDGQALSFYDGPVDGFTDEAKKAILENSLEILRITEDGRSAQRYVWMIAQQFDGKSIKVDVQEVMSVDEFMESEQY